MSQQSKFKQTEIGMIPEDWELIKLKNYLKISPRNGVYKGKENQRKGIDIVKMGTLFSSFFIDDQDMEKFGLDQKEKRIFLLEKDDLVFARTSLILEGVGKCAIVDTDSREIAFESNTFRIRLDNNKINPKYILYFFRSRVGRHFIDAIASQTAATSIKSSDLVNISLPIPKKSEQDKVAQVLYNLDTRIKILKQMNKTIEAIGQALFKHWFVDFEFPNEEGKPYKSSGGEMVFNEELGKEIPRGWAVKELKEIVSQLKPGTNYQPKRVKEGVPFVNVKNIVNGFLNLNDVKKITEEEYKRVHKAWIPEKHDILITRIGTLGNVGIIRKKDLPVAVHYNNIDIKAKMTSCQFIYFFLKSKEFQKMYHLKKKQSVQEYVTIEEVETIKVILPNNTKLLKNLEKEFISLLNKIELNANNIESLQKTRDSLLPKLMSGKIIVPIEVE